MRGIQEWMDTHTAHQCVFIYIYIYIYIYMYELCNTHKYSVPTKAHNTQLTHLMKKETKSHN